MRVNLNVNSEVVWRCGDTFGQSLPLSFHELSLIHIIPNFKMIFFYLIIYEFENNFET